VRYTQRSELIRPVGGTLLIVRAKNRSLWTVIAAVVIAVATLGLLYAVWRSPHRSDLATFGAFAVAVVALVSPFIARTWQARTRKAELGTESQELDDRADRLAEEVRKEWERVANERGLVTPIPVRWGIPTPSLAVSAAAAVGSQRFDPLPGLPPVGETQLAAGQISDLHSVYGGLGSGRLVIAGAPGSGKSGAAVLLILAALRYRRQVAGADRPQVPVPVLFTAHDWDPGSQRIEGWLAEHMRQTYRFAGRAAPDAAALIDAGKVALILDGLDEMAENRRPDALRELSRQAAFRVVILSRAAEMASAVSKQGVLEGAAAIELHPIDPGTAADYLSHIQRDPPPDSWRELVDQVRSQGSPVARALDNPLTLTLVRDTYRTGDVGELLKFCNTAQRRVSGDHLAEAITGHLLDGVLPAAYAPRPAERTPRYDLATAQRALTKIAARMNQDGSRDLQWWHIPDWAPAAPRILAGVGVGVGAGAALGVWAGVKAGPMSGYATGLLAGVGAAIGAGVAAGRSGHTPRRIGKLRARRALSETNFGAGVTGGLAGGIWFGLIIGLLAGVVAGHRAGAGAWAGLATGILVGLTGGLVAGLIAGLAGGLAFALDDLQDPDGTSSPDPLTSQQADRRYGLAVGLLAGVVAGAAVWLLAVAGAGAEAGVRVVAASGVWAGVWAGLLAGARAGVVPGLIAGLAFVFFVGGAPSSTWSSSLASAQLARRWHTPVRLMRFLDDAHERGVLRTVGPVYQFRHARLQDRLAEQDNSPP
jgi:hypothetical protein